MEMVLAALGANALVLGVLAYLFKTLISSRLERDMAEFKAALERKAAEEMAKYRAQIEKDRLRMQISYGGIFERQATAIIEVHGAVVALERGAGAAIHLGGTTQERRKSLEQPLRDLRQILLDKQILLTPEVDKAVDAFLAKLPRAVRTYVAADAKDFSRLSPQEMDKVFEDQERAMEIIEKEVPELRDRLVAEMRRVIGVVASEF